MPRLAERTRADTRVPAGERGQLRPSAAASRTSAGHPDDPARLIAWLVTDEAAWITGQVIHSAGGFRRWD